LIDLAFYGPLIDEKKDLFSAVKGGGAWEVA
jgi:hypothetical protein